MKRYVSGALFGLLFCTGLMSGPAVAADAGQQVLNPTGLPPVIQRVPMSPRLDELRGKTIYIVDIGFTDTHQLLTEMRDLMAARHPDTNWEVRMKTGPYYLDDPELWEEIRSKGDGMIIGVGH